MERRIAKTLVELEEALVEAGLTEGRASDLVDDIEAKVDEALVDEEDALDDD